MKIFNTVLSLIILCLNILNSTNAQTRINTNKDLLPADFTQINAEVIHESKFGEYFFFAFMSANTFPDLTPYLVIADDYGTPIYYKKYEKDVTDFKVQPNGMLSFNDSKIRKHILMDSSYQICDTISYLNQIIDFHDFHILDNGNYLLLGLSIRIVDMDTVIEGGQPGVTVAAADIQIQDTAQNILFEWSAWDHFQITDSNTDLLNPNFIDFTHSNAIEMDTDSTILISNRNMNEITKINLHNGEIIWRLGGKNNQFTYIGEDTIGFGGQHDIRRLSDGSYQLFDNGWTHMPFFSSALKLDLDEENMTARVINRLRSQPEDINAFIMGNAQQLPDGGTVIGWGSGAPNITEFDSAGNKLVEFSYEAYSYRAFKFPWETKAFSFDQENITFDESYLGDSATATLSIRNKLSDTLCINKLVSRSGLFYPGGTFPLSIPAGDSAILDILFIPDTLGVFDDILTFACDVENDTLTQRIAKQIMVSAEAVEGASIFDIHANSLEVFPNPTLGISMIVFGNPGLKICKVFDLKGQIIREFSTRSLNYQLDLTSQISGMYFMSVINENGEQVIMKILKQ